MYTDCSGSPYCFLGINTHRILFSDVLRKPDWAERPVFNCTDTSCSHPFALEKGHLYEDYNVY